MHPTEGVKDSADGYMEKVILHKVLLNLISIESGSFFKERSNVGNNDSRDVAMSTTLVHKGIVRNTILAMVLQGSVDEALLDAEN